MPKRNKPTFSAATDRQRAAPPETGASARHAILVARQAPDERDDEVRVSLQELTHLLEGLGVAATGTLVQRRSSSSSGVLGQGKRKELAALLDEQKQTLGATPLVVFDGELSPRHTRELEKELDASVLDRTGVILRVFEGRGGTDLARLELAIARLNYDAPRVRDEEILVGRGGGGGGRGARGHSNVVLRKEQLRERVAGLRRELERATAGRDAQRQRRADVPQVALVGYTNAGKSSLLRALTGSEVLVEDKLFATLGTTVRALAPPTVPRILVSDTVGFLRRLPNELLASFHSTLEEAREADLLLLIVDAADPEWRAQLAVTRETLAAIGADSLPTRVVLNKIDRVDDVRRAALEEQLPDAIALSAHSLDDVMALREHIVAFFDEQLVGDRLPVPHAEGKLLADIRARSRVLHEEYRDDVVLLALRAPAHDLERWRRALPPLPPLETADELLAAAAAQGLELTSEHDELDGMGLDFRVLHAQDAEGTPWIVRTPRRPSVWEASLVESRVLRLVAPRLPVKVPEWRLHARDVIAYPRLDGVPAVTLEDGAPTWNRIDPAAPSERFVESFARMLVALQSVPLDVAKGAGVPVKTIEEQRSTFARALERTRDVLQPSDAVWQRWQRWLHDDDVWPQHLALGHGDLHPGHMLLAEDGALTGVLDWTEACVSDPVVDLAMFHGCFGRDVLSELVARFERQGGRTWPRIIEHAMERWAAWPVLGALWALEHENDGVLEHVRATLATIREETEAMMR